MLNGVCAILQLDYARSKAEFTEGKKAVTKQSDHGSMIEAWVSIQQLTQPNIIDLQTGTLILICDVLVHTHTHAHAVVVSCGYSSISFWNFIKETEQSPALTRFS